VFSGVSLTNFSTRTAYYHEMLLEGRPHLALLIRRFKRKGNGPRKAASPEAEPNFYSMPPLPLTNVSQPMLLSSASTAEKYDTSRRVFITEPGGQVGSCRTQPQQDNWQQKTFLANKDQQHQKRQSEPKANPFAALQHPLVRPLRCELASTTEHADVACQETDMVGTNNEVLFSQASQQELSSFIGDDEESRMFFAQIFDNSVNGS
jgi:hypothetical protein